MFEDKIINITPSRFRNLQRPAKIAATKPDTCVKIENKSAYYVIKDCADITLKYLPHFIYSGIKDPISKLRGNITEGDIQDFAKRALKEDHTQQLLRLILDDISRRDIQVHTPQASSSADIDFTLTGEETDVYGDYDFEVTPVEEHVEESVMTITNITDYEAVTSILISALT